MSGFGWKGVELGSGGSPPFGWHKPLVVNPPNQAPVLVTAPTIFPSGAQIIGTTFTSGNGTWFGTMPITFEYRWTRNGVPISGATSQTYISVIADEEQILRCEVRATNAFGVSDYEASSNSAIGAYSPFNTIAPVISGSTELGSTLSCTTGTWIGVPDFFYFTYQWNRNGVPILGATNNTYVTVLADSLADITCTVTASNCFRLAFNSPYNSGYYSTYFH